jgi:pimeloyl-ACP methyl ester carboxylesterase
MAPRTNPPIKTLVRTIDGLSIRYAESERRDNHALLVGPWPESLMAFEQVWGPLAEHAHLIAIDLPGYGHSDGRADLYQSRTMGDFVVRLADEFELECLHGVGPGIGVATFLFAASAHPNRFQSLVIGSGCAAVPLQLGVELQRLIEASDVEFLRGLDPSPLVNEILNHLERYELPASIREDYLTAYLGDRFVKSLGLVRAYPQELPVLADLLPHINTPVQIIHGDHDGVFLPVNANFLHKRLPHSKLDFLDGNHFLCEDRAAEYATLVLDWWNGGYRHV